MLAPACFEKNFKKINHRAIRQELVAMGESWGNTE